MLIKIYFTLKGMLKTISMYSDIIKPLHILRLVLAVLAP